MDGHAEVPGCKLSWSLIDLTPPWVAAPETIVMHHGIGANRHIFDGWLPGLVGTHRILRFDMRGHGASARPTDAPLDLDRLTDDLFAVMDAAGVERAHLLGKSIGGTIVLNAALRSPERVANADRQQRRPCRRFDPVRRRVGADDPRPGHGRLVGLHDAGALLSRRHHRGAGHMVRRAASDRLPRYGPADAGRAGGRRPDAPAAGAALAHSTAAPGQLPVHTGASHGGASRSVPDARLHVIGTRATACRSPTRKPAPACSRISWPSHEACATVQAFPVLTGQLGFTR